MSAIAPRAGRRVHERMVGLLAGHPWGVLSMWPSRYGYAQYRLTIYPPGTSRSERFRLRLWRALPQGSLALGIVIVVLGVPMGIALPACLECAAVLDAALLITLARATRRQRPRVRSISGAVDLASTPPRLDGDMAMIRRLSGTLATADQRLATGRITPCDHELVWAGCWALLAR